MCYPSDVSYLYIRTTLHRNRFWHVAWITISSYNPIPNKQPLKWLKGVFNDSITYCYCILLYFNFLFWRQFYVVWSLLYLCNTVSLYKTGCSLIFSFYAYRFLKTTTFIRNDVFQKCSCGQIDTENWIPYVISNDLVYL